MITLTLDPIKKTATLTGEISIADVDEINQKIAELSDRISILEAGTPQPVPAGITPILEFLEEKPDHIKAERPSWVTQVPQGLQGYSLEFGTESGNYYLRVPVPDALKNIAELTICGWIYRTSDQFGYGGNRVIDWLHNYNGVDFVLSSRGFQLGINEFPDNVPISGEGTELNKWNFFAVTYSASEGVQYFKGTQETELSLLVSFPDYRGKLIGGRGSASVTIGNFNPELIESNPGVIDRSFKGLLHGLRIFNKSLSLEQIKSYQYK